MGAKKRLTKAKLDTHTEATPALPVWRAVASPRRAILGDGSSFACVGPPVWILAERWFDARDAARQALGLSTVDGLSVSAWVLPMPARSKVLRVTYRGAGYNGTLERVVEEVG